MGLQLEMSAVMLTAQQQQKVSCKHQMVDCWAEQKTELADCLMPQQL